MASQENKRELRDKVAALATNRFHGDFQAAFRHYDLDGNGLIDVEELKTLLADAGIGSSWTRWAWVSGIISEIDKDGDGKISWPEFASAFEFEEG